MFDDVEDRWVYLYLGWDHDQVRGEPGTVSVNLAYPAVTEGR